MEPTSLTGVAKGDQFVANGIVHCHCDILHTLAPTFCLWRKQSQPALLADWLNPGHETWVMLRYQEVTPERVRQVMDWGMAPVTMSRIVELGVRSLGQDK